METLNELETKNIVKSTKGSSKEYIFVGKDIDKTSQEFKVIYSITSQLVANRATHMGAGHCFSISDIVYSMLTQANIKCRIVECKYLLANKQERRSYMVGHPVPPDDIPLTKMNTHVVVVTETKQPIMLDLSLSHQLPGDLHVLLLPVFNGESNVFAQEDNISFSATYQEKKTYDVPKLHEFSILNRILTDQKFADDIQVLKKLNYAGIGISLIALIAVILRWVL